MAEINDDEMFSMSYKDARDKYAVGVGNNKYFMSESDFNKGKERINKKNAEKPKEEKPKKEQSLIANKFGAKKEKTWNDVKSEYNNDPAKIADYLNTATDYTPGNLTKKGMEEFGYSKGDDGKWAPKPKTETNTTNSATNATTEGSTTDTTSSTTTNATTDDSLSELEKLMAENEKLKEQIEGFQNSDGSVNEPKAYDAMSQYEQKLVEMGVGSFDEDNKFVFKDTTKKGWEDWATMLSAGASVIGLAMGIPIMPINFRKITNKDEKDAKIREFQKQYADIMAGNAAKIKDAESSKTAGDYIKKNQDSIDAFTNYAEKTAAYEAKSDIDTDKETALINAKLEAEQKLAEAAFKNKVAEMKLSHDQRKDLEELMSNLSTDSAKELLNQGKFGYLLDYVKQAKEAGIDDRAIALKLQSLAGNTATSQNLKHAESVVGMFAKLIDAVM